SRRAGPARPCYTARIPLVAPGRSLPGPQGSDSRCVPHSSPLQASPRLSFQRGRSVMSLPFWTQRQQKRITTRAKRLSRKVHGTGARAARYCLPRLEELEDRTVLSSVTRDFSGSGAQFAGFNPAITTFLGDEFDRSASFGSVRHVDLLGDFGATANM